MLHSYDGRSKVMHWNFLFHAWAICSSGKLNFSACGLMIAACSSNSQVMPSTRNPQSTADQQRSIDMARHLPFCDFPQNVEHQAAQFAIHLARVGETSPELLAIQVIPYVPSTSFNNLQLEKSEKEQFFGNSKHSKL